MSSIGICEYCKHIDKDIAEKPCLHCSANLGAFEFDISEHDAKIRADAIDKFKNFIRSNKHYFVGDMAEMLIYEFEQMQLKEQNK